MHFPHKFLHPTSPDVSGGITRSTLPETHFLRFILRHTMKIPPTATTTPMNRQTQGNEPPVGDTADNVPSGNSTYGIPSAKSAYVLK